MKEVPSYVLDVTSDLETGVPQPVGKESNRGQLSSPSVITVLC